MQLKKIRLAGFKSFVDPTQVLLPSNLVAIVGPNGCGKSNIIDAVCWVMGESSAKYLRGESLTDVIFNGSSARKPVGQASVELVFDNQDGSFSGEYGTYAEISIKRVITRDADSSYFLNGTRCRRRDIIDIFLGTGLGPRSYSIIGQNMISRIIEAKPEEMRVYLEEAAGISKYKERRRETENRIHHTKENIARLTDLRTELDKQLTSLKRQANAAEKFQTFKQEERVIRAQWLAIQWREYDRQLIQLSLQVQQQETGYEARQAELLSISRSLEHKREEQQSTSDSFQDVQRRYYAAGNEITRIEQEIHHTEERKRQWQADVDQVEKDCLHEETQLKATSEKLVLLQEEIAELEPEIKEAQNTAGVFEGKLLSSEEAMQTWQQQWDEFNQHISKTNRTVEVEKTRIQHLEQKLQVIRQRQAVLEQDKNQFNFSQLSEELEMLSKQVEEGAELGKNQNEQLKQIRDTLSSEQAALQQATKTLDQKASELQRLRGQQASLETLQQTALGQRNNPIIQWLQKHQLDKRPRLAQEVEVESGWEHAVEKALGAHLQAVCIDELSQAASWVSDLQKGNVCLFAANNSASSSDHAAASLLSKIKSKHSLDSLLSGIYVAENQAEALALAGSLKPHESVITRDGIWLTSSWMQVSLDESPEAGVFQREQELKLLAQNIADRAAEVSELEKTIASSRQQLKELELKRDELQKAANQTHAKTAEITAQHKAKNERLAELKIRYERCIKEQEESANQLQKAQQELDEAQTNFKQAAQDLEKQTEQRDAMTRERDDLRQKLQSTREQLNQAKDEMHDHEIRWETAKSQLVSLQQNIARMQSQLNVYAERKVHLQSEIQSVSPVENLQQTLSTALSQRLEIEAELNKVRAVMESLEQERRLLETRRQELEQEISKFRDQLEILRVDSQGIKVKAETLLDQLRQTDSPLEEILKVLPEEAQVQEWQSQLDQITTRISRLGAINLVAIEEFAVCSERKTYLDNQHNDLQEGLNTLEDAIAKIDKETRTRFKETFDKVNEHFQQLFPTIFGGGRSYLELSGENLLDAGVAVMACPPGKRNSTIHLLSGGEKAMTAIALIFSIFQLNPAPFCLLDEVDAPLDDANIGRFCHLVKNMAEKTQFIFISHNKLAIEMAEHLMGVTMHEPGVSRLVTVNIEEAVNLAGA